MFSSLLPKSAFSSSVLFVRWWGFSLALLLGGASAAQAQTTTPFACTAGKSYVFQSDVTTGTQVDVSTGQAGTSSSPILSSGNQKLNAFGYNQVDNYIWGLRLGSNQLVQVGSDFKANVFNVTGLSNDGANSVVGDVSATGTMYITRGGSTGGGGGTQTIYSIDLTQTLTAANPSYQASAFATTVPSYINDWAVSPNDGHLYAIYATIASAGNAAALTLYRFLTSPITANGTTLPVGTRQNLGTVVPDNSTGATNPIAASNYASVFMDKPGNFYVVSSDNGFIYRITTPNTTPVNLTAYYIGTGPSGSLNNDGARCAQSAIAPPPLPVTLVSFAAAAVPNRAVHLDWNTASEPNNDFFEVQHSLDGRTFAAVGRVAGHGSSLRPAAYSFTDAAPGDAAAHYYRLRQVDRDGTGTFSPVRAVALAPGTSALQLAAAPNPTTPGNLRVQVQYGGQAPTPAVLTLHSLLGQALFTQAVTLQPGANVFAPSPAVAPGVYWLTVGGAAALGTRGTKVLLTN